LSAGITHLVWRIAGGIVGETGIEFHVGKIDFCLSSHPRTNPSWPAVGRTWCPPHTNWVSLPRW